MHKKPIYGGAIISITGTVNWSFVNSEHEFAHVL